MDEESAPQEITCRGGIRLPGFSAPAAARVAVEQEQEAGE